LELEAALGQDLRLEPGDERRREHGLVEGVGDEARRLIA
jgi:hypothetical protein